MRKCWLIAILLLVVGCSKDIDFEPSQDQAQNRILSGIIADEKDEDNESRVYLDNKIRIRWNKGDLISVFDGTTRNKEFAFLGADGSSAGDFEDNSAGTIGTGNAIDRLYGLYPYASSTEYCYGEDESEADYLRYTLPATQTYKPNSIGLNANLMVAATANKSDKTLVFRNVCSYLRLKLYGADQTVSSIVFKGNTDEVLTGDVAITATYGNAPTIKMLGAADEDNKTITLDCSEGITIGSTSDEATEFWLVVPPVNFPNGFTITVYGEGNMGQEIVVNNNLTFARNTYNTITREVAMTEVSDPSTEIPNNQIWYTSSDGKVVEPYSGEHNNYADALTTFGANIVSNTYENGKGVIKFDGAVTSIGDYAFRYCESLTEITIPNSVTSIGKYAFADCSSLTSITIPNSVTSIRVCAFYECSSLTEITIPNGVTSIGDYTFAYCSSLTDVSIGNSVTSIGKYAFAWCSSLTEITIPNSVTSIGNNAFRNCESLTEITIPNSVTSIGEGAFSRCIHIQKFYGRFAEDNGRCLVNDGVLIAYAEASGTEYTIPNSVTSIGESAFFYCRSLTSITIPNSVTSIGSSAFRYCDSLTEVTIGNGVTSIGMFAFRSCSRLTEITIPNSVTIIGLYAFEGCSSLQNIFCERETPPTGGQYMFQSIHSSARIYVPAGSGEAYKTAPYWSDYASIIEEMGVPDNEIWYTATAKVTPYKTDVFGANIVSNTYENGKGVIKFDGAVTSIGAYAFSICSSLTEVTIPNGVTSIGQSAFEDCHSLTEITIPNSVTSIGYHAFLDCSSLTEITIPNSVTSIGESAFVLCSSLTEITIPNSVTSIGVSAFSGCSSLQKFYGKFAEDNGRCLVNDGVLIAYAEASGTSYTIPNSVTSIGEGAFSSCSSLTEITLPNSVTSIGEWTFASCSSLTEIAIPNSVTSIGDWAFGYCSSLTEITIPNSVTSIGNYAFYECSSLQNIICEPTTPPTGRYAMFSRIHSSAKIYVPAGSGEAYKTAPYWSDYASIIEEDLDRVEDPNPSSTSFKRRAMVMQFTGTDCPYCPYMIEPLEQLAADAAYKDKFSWAAIHTFNPLSDPAAPRNSEDQQKLGSTFGISGYPTVLVDIGTMVGNSNNNIALNLANLKKAVDNSVANAPSAGISAAMTLDENNRVVTARVSVKAKDSNIYRVSMWLLEDNIKGGQSGSSTITSHDHAVRYVARGTDGTVNYVGYELNDGKTMTAGQVADYVFSINIRDQSVKLANCKLIFFVTTSTGNSYTVVNSVVSTDLKTAIPFEYEN